MKCRVLQLPTLALLLGGVGYIFSASREYAREQHAITEYERRAEVYEHQSALARIDHDARLARHQEEMFLVKRNGAETRVGH